MHKKSLLFLSLSCILSLGQLISVNGEIKSNETAVEDDDDSPLLDKSEFKEEIARFFGLPRIPMDTNQIQIGTNHSIMKFMTDIYEYTLSCNKINYINSNRRRRGSGNFALTTHHYHLIDESNFLISFSAQGLNKNVIERANEIRNMRFNIFQVSNDEILAHAELRFYHTKYDTIFQNKEKFTITVDQISHPNRRDTLKTFVTSSETSAEYEGWIAVDVSNLVDYWSRNITENRGVRVTATRTDKATIKEMRPERIGIVGFDDEEDKQPFLVAYYRYSGKFPHEVESVKKINRTKRGVKSTLQILHTKLAKKNNKQSTNPCSAVDYQVNFDDIGFGEWIIAPHTVNLRYCTGECAISQVTKFNMTAHALVQATLHTLYPEKVPMPCCAPEKLSALSVLHWTGNNGIVLKKYDDMILDSCACF